MSTITAPQAPNATTKDGGKGNTHGLVSELSAFLHVKPGCQAQLEAACLRFHQRLVSAPLSYMIKFGLTDMRHVVFDNGTRLAWLTAFETEWDPYIDDSLDMMGLKTWTDWLQYCEESPADINTYSHAELKAFLQRIQVRAIGFFRAIPNVSMSQIEKGQRVVKAFEQVLDSPNAAQLLAEPALKPLAEEATD